MRYKVTANKILAPTQQQPYQPTYGPQVNQLTVPQPLLGNQLTIPTQLSQTGMSQPNLYSPRRMSMHQLRSKSLVHSENDRISSRRNSFQRQNSIDISGENFVLLSSSQTLRF